MIGVAPDRLNTTMPSVHPVTFTVNCDAVPVGVMAICVIAGIENAVLPGKFVAPVTVVVLKSVTGSLKVTRTLAVAVPRRSRLVRSQPTITVGGPIVSGIGRRIRGWERRPSGWWRESPLSVTSPSGPGQSGWR